MKTVMLCASLLLVARLGAAEAAGDGPGQHEGERLRVMTWNVHHGEGVEGRVDLGRIAALIRRERVSLVALQEVDRGVARTGKRDFPAELAGLTGMECVFSNNFHYQGGEYGNAILTGLPIASWTNRHYRMLRSGEQRGLLEVELQWAGRSVRFFSTHLDYRADDSERRDCVAMLRRVVESDTQAVSVVAGDFNDQPASRVHRGCLEFLDDAWLQAGAGSGNTYPAGDPDRRIDYLFFTPGRGIRLVGVGVVESLASDHRPLVAEFAAEKPTGR